jgi:N-acetylmuramoyl-L-alanine amidase
VHAAFRFGICLLTGAGLLIALRPVDLRGQTQPTPQAAAQPAPPTPPHPPPQRALVIIDPGHGGTDPGADLGNKIAEKDVTLALATKLRTALAAQGFTVVLTREPDATGAISSDQRAQTANHSRALACVSLHATRSGSGVHIYTSALQPTSDTADTSLVPVRWDAVQERYVGQSAQFAGELKSAFANAGLPADVRTATVPPLDNLMCPAVAIELAPVGNVTSAEKGADAASYQDNAVKAIAAGLSKWRTDTAPQPQPAAAEPSPAKGAQ